ncbi:penicillin-binding transpeptidase domain-containing protein, partial [Campylobacter insulaenigrae]
KDALTGSRNLATINLALSLGLDVIHDKLSNMGFNNIPVDLSIVLGSFGISIYDYAELYTVFGNYGVQKELILIKRVLDKDGKVVVEFNSNEKRISDPAQAFLVNDMMQNVVKEGTGKNAKVKDIEIAGKTGTSNKSIDAWFCGITPEIEAIIWYGNDDNKPMRQIEGGARTAAPVFKDFLTKYLELYPDSARKFKIPNGVFQGFFEKSKEYYTQTSPFPKRNSILLENNEIIF